MQVSLHCLINETSLEDERCLKLTNYDDEFYSFQKIIEEYDYPDISDEDFKKQSKRIKLYYTDQLTGDTYAGIKNFDTKEEIYFKCRYLNADSFYSGCTLESGCYLHPFGTFLIKPNRGFDVSGVCATFEMTDEQMDVLAKYVTMFMPLRWRKDIEETAASSPSANVKIHLRTKLLKKG